MLKKHLNKRILSKEVDHKSYELSALFEVAKGFLEIKDLNALKKQIVISALGILGAKGGTLLEFDSTNKTLAIAVSLGQKSKTVPKSKFILRKKWQDFLVRKKHGMPLDLAFVTRDSNLRAFAQANFNLLRTVEPKLVASILEEEKLWGLLCLQEKLLNKGYSLDDYNLLNSFTNLAAKAWGSLVSIKPGEKKESAFLAEDPLSKLPRLKIKKELSSLRKGYPILKDIVGESRAILSAFRSVLEVAKTKCPVLILGDTGTGKELIARCIHLLSLRGDGPFVELNCASIPSELIESELFGYEKGAFTGATGDRKGVFELANNGTLFLDEIGDMSLNLQTKLLRVIQEGRFRRLGGEKNIEVDVRILTASNKDLVREARKGNFREDLLYRINVYPIYLSTLEERKEDIPLLADYFLRHTATEFGLPLKSFSPEALRLLREYRYPGNVRELKNIVERVAIRSGDQKVIDGFWLEQESKGRKRERLDLSEELSEEFSPASRMTEPQLIFEAELSPEESEPIEPQSSLTFSEIERSHILRVLKMTKQNKTQAAKILGLPRTTLIGKMRKLGIM